MDKHKIFANIRDVLAHLFPTSTSARIVLADAGVDEKRILFSERAIENWFNILNETQKQKKIVKLLDTALTYYPDNQDLLKAYKAHQKWLTQDSSTDEQEISTSTYTRLPRSQSGFQFDAYISYVDEEPDSNWVWDILVPKLEEAGLCIAISGDADKPGVAKIVNIEQGIKSARRTVIILSNLYLKNSVADFANVLAQTQGVHEGHYRLIPVKIEPLEQNLLPGRLKMLTTLDMVHPRRSDREFKRLIQALHEPIPPNH